MSKQDQVSMDAALRHLPYGVHVITTRGSQGDHGVTASWVMQVSKAPPMVAVALRKGSHSADAVASAGAFAVNLLSVAGVAVAEKFLTPVDRFGAPAKPVFTRGVLQMPLLSDAIGWLECQVRSQVDTGDHLLFLGEVIAGDLKKDDVPLTTIGSGLRYGGVKP
jgi:flavin reductase (DIM6/NTAB) family NADH-FMN oxidoreductase RutF